MIKIIIVLVILSFMARPLPAQCPDRLTVMNRIVKLKTSSADLKEQLRELQDYIPLFERCHIKNDSVFAFLLQRIGALYYFLADYNKAVNWSEKSIHAITDPSNTVSNPVFLIKVYNYLQVFYDSLNLIRQKMTAIDSCVQIAVRTDRINDEVLYNLWQRVDYSFDVGDYQRCADYSKLGLSITRYCSNKQDGIIYSSNFFSEQINSLIHLNKLDDAESIITDKISDYKHRNDEKNCGFFYNELAEVNTQKGNYGRSIEFLIKSLKSNHLIKYQFGLKQTFNNIGYLYLIRLKKPDLALYYFYKSLSCRNNVAADKVRDVIETLNIYDNIANAYAWQHKFDSAYLFYKKAFDQLKPGIDEKNILNFSPDEFIANKKMQYLTGLIKDKGDARLWQYLATKDKASINDAISIYKVADKVLTRVKTEQSESASGIAWRSNARNLYEHAIEACFLSNDINDVFYFFEKSRAALLSDQVNEQRHSSREDIRKQKQIKRKLIQLRNGLNQAIPSSSQYTELQKDIYTAIQENDLISQNIKKRDPLYFQRYIDTDFISVASIKKNILKADHSLMEIFYGDSAVYILFISDKDSRIKKVDKNKYDLLTNAFIRYISDPGLLNRYFSKFVQTAHDLYSLMFDHLPVPAWRLIISPDGKYFPFEALAMNYNFNSPRYLIYDHPVSYAYSAGYLDYDSVGSSKDTSRLLLGMAPVHFYSSSHLPDLPASDGSLKNISSFFKNSDEFTNAAATKNIFLNNFYNYKLVQLYTHASDGGLRGEPEIYFADSSLRLSDIDPVFRPATRLVVLSACETGSGNFYKGEGVFSFNRRFASIGIPSSLVNLWSVDNQAVYSLTELFYKYLSAGFPLDIALQKAKTGFIKSSPKAWSMPYYWAAAVMVGKTDPPVACGPAFSWLWALLLFIPIIIIWFAHKMRD